jgi:multiple sugar transport system permease protein
VKVIRARRSERFPRKKHSQRDNRALGFIFSLPGLIVLTTVVLMPLILGFYYSVTNKSLLSSQPTKFVGLRNYQTDVFTRDFSSALIVSLKITFFSILTQLLTGYAIAKMLTRKLAGTSFFVTVFMLPMLLTPVAVGMMWSLMLNPDIGVIKWLQHFVGLNINFLGSPTAAMSALVLLEWWGHLPFVVLVLMAGILNLPKEVLEAASIDGANWFQTNLRVIIPMLAPVIAVVAIIRSINAFRMFDTIFVLTNGGPGSSTVNLPFMAFKTAFTYFDTSRASAIAVAIVVLVLPVYFILLRITKV